MNIAGVFVTIVIILASLFAISLVESGSAFGDTGPIASGPGSPDVRNPKQQSQELFFPPSRLDDCPYGVYNGRC